MKILLAVALPFLAVCEEAPGDIDIAFRPDTPLCEDCALTLAGSARTQSDANSSLDIILAEPAWSSGGTCSDVGRFHVWYNDGDDWYTQAPDATWNRDSSGVVEATACGDEFGWAVTGARYNNDAFGDIVVGVPGDTASGNAGAGSIHVFYGSSSGITATNDYAIFQSDIGQNDETDDFWGEVLAEGDFNDDGFSDVAVGAPREDVGAVADAGYVAVLYGSSSGITTGGAQAWHQNTDGISDSAEAGDSCGARLASGDFNNDGYFDLAIACPNEDIGAAIDAGSVHVLYGSSAGLTASGSQFWNQDSSGITDSAQTNDDFGSYLLAADYSGDGIDDLVVSVSDGCANGPNQAVLRGGSGGLSSTNNSLECVAPASGSDCSGCVSSSAPGTAATINACTCEGGTECARLAYPAADDDCRVWYGRDEDAGYSVCDC